MDTVRAMTVLAHPAWAQLDNAFSRAIARLFFLSMPIKSYAERVNTKKKETVEVYVMIVDEHGFEVEQLYVVGVEDVDISAMDPNKYIGTLFARNGRNDYELEWSFDAKTHETTFDYYQQNEKGQWEKGDLPLDAVQSMKAYQKMVLQAVQEYQKENNLEVSKEKPKAKSGDEYDLF